MSATDREAPRLPRLRDGLLRRRVERRAPLRFHEGCAVEVYHEGVPALEAMEKAIRDARERVHLETYIFRGDRTGRRFVEALAERARAGLRVRVLCDGFGARGADDGLFEELCEAGGDVVFFNPLGRIIGRRPLRRRDHRKLLVVDGRVAFVGGLNIGDEYAAAGGWRDTHLRVQGPVVRQLDAVFVEGWLRADGPGSPMLEILDDPVEAAGSLRCAVLADGPTYRRRRTRRLVLEGLAAARERVAFASPYFAPGLRVLEAITRAAARGVRVDLLLAGKTDHPVLRHAARSFLPRLLARGVHVYEYEPAMMHAKVALFDGRRALIGTANLDRQSLRHSYEVSLVIDDRDFCRQLEERLVVDFAHSKRWTLQRLEHRSWLERLVDRVCALLLPFV